MEENRSTGKVPIVLHYRDGRTAQFSSHPRIERARQAIVVEDESGTEFEVPFSSLKAVFFIRIEDEPEEHHAGTPLLVEFRDGEKIRGVSDEYHADRNGFFLIPADRTKNDRIFVVDAAIVSVEAEGP
jgi:hypothetical protein